MRAASPRMALLDAGDVAADGAVRCVLRRRGWRCSTRLALLDACCALKMAQFDGAVSRRMGVLRVADPSAVAAYRERVLGNDTVRSCARVSGSRSWGEQIARGLPIGGQRAVRERQCPDDNLKRCRVGFASIAVND
jgi:hypothetical protein